MDWKIAEEMLVEMWITYTRDSIRKITYNKEIFPLALKFYTGERTAELYHGIVDVHRQLIFYPSLE